MLNKFHFGQEGNYVQDYTDIYLHIYKYIRIYDKQITERFSCSDGFENT